MPEITTNLAAEIVILRWGRLELVVLASGWAVWRLDGRWLWTVQAGQA